MLGPNGAGKTTILRMIATLMMPTSGTILVNGHDSQKDALEIRKKIGFLTGSTKLYDRLTPYEVVRYFAQLHKMPPDRFEARCEQLFDLLDVQDYRHRRIGKLSTGMRQRVSLVRTIIHDPAVVIFDEVTAGLDVIGSQSIIKLTRNLREEGKTVIFSTHIMGEVALLSDDLAIIHKGRLVYGGSFEEFSQEMVAESLEAEFIRRTGEVS